MMILTFNNIIYISLNLSIKQNCIIIPLEPYIVIEAFKTNFYSTTCFVVFSCCRHAYITHIMFYKILLPF